MNYKSPFHYLPVAALQQSELNPIEIQRAKKRVLAEFELKDPGVENKLTANEIVQWLDSLKPEEIRFHQLIFDNKALLNFLEKGTVDQENWYEKSSVLKSDQEARNFIFPLVQKKFDLLFAEAFRSRDLSKIKELSGFYLPELDKKGRVYYASTTNQLKVYYHQLLQITTNWEAGKEKQLLEFLQQPFLGFLKELPLYFQPIRNEFVSCLQNFLTERSNDTRQQPKIIKETLTAISNINSSYQPERSKKLILKPKGKDKGKNPEKGGCRSVFIFFVLLIVLVKIIGMVLGLMLN